MGPETQILACAGLCSLGCALLSRRPLPAVFAVALTGAVVGIWAQAWGVLARSVSGIVVAMPTTAILAVLGNALLGVISGMIAVGLAWILGKFNTASRRFLYVAIGIWISGIFGVQLLAASLKLHEAAIITLIITGFGCINAQVFHSSRSKAA